MEFQKSLKRTAILVDGGFYRTVAYRLYGAKSPEERAQELELSGIAALSAHPTLPSAALCVPSATTDCISAGICEYIYGCLILCCKP